MVSGTGAADGGQMNIGGFSPDHVQITLDGPRSLGRKRLRTEDPRLWTKGANGDNYRLVPVEYRPVVRNRQNGPAEPCAATDPARRVGFLVT
jgi:hypothetical protein